MEGRKERDADWVLVWFGRSSASLGTNTLRIEFPERVQQSRVAISCVFAALDNVSEDGVWYLVCALHVLTQ